MVGLIPRKIPVWATLSYYGYPIFGRGMPGTELGNVQKSYKGISLWLYFRDNVHVSIQGVVFSYNLVLPKFASTLDVIIVVVVMEERGEPFLLVFFFFFFKEAVELIFASNESNASGTVRKRQRTTTTVTIQSSRRSDLRDVDVCAVGVMNAATGRWKWEWG
jgi:hypothetical protein